MVKSEEIDLNASGILFVASSVTRPARTTCRTHSSSSEGDLNRLVPWSSSPWRNAEAHHLGISHSELARCTCSCCIAADGVWCRSRPRFFRLCSLA